MIWIYLLHILILIGIYVILALSLNLSFGFAGLPNLGHITFYAAGAYTSALLALTFNLPFWLCILISGIVASFLGLIQSLPIQRLKGDYFILYAIGFVVVIESILKNWVSLTNGAMGIAGISRPTLFGFQFNSVVSYLFLVIFFVVITYIVIRKITISPFGRVLKAINEDELTTKVLGKNTFKCKVFVLVSSGFFAGIAGYLYAHYVTFIDPTTFSISESMLIMCAVILGGLASLEGSIIGASALIILPEFLRLFGFAGPMIGPLRQIIFAILLIFIILKYPKGIMGKNKLK